MSRVFSCICCGFMRIMQSLACDLNAKINAGGTHHRSLLIMAFYETLAQHASQALIIEANMNTPS